jgi:hypothetical protein
LGPGIEYSVLPVKSSLAVDLWEFYEQVETLIGDLRSSGYAAESSQVEIAIRHGATCGEILGRLSGVLPRKAYQALEFRSEAMI